MTFRSRTKPPITALNIPATSQADLRPASSLLCGAAPASRGAQLVADLLAPASLAWMFGWCLMGGATVELKAAPPATRHWAQRAEAPANTSTELDWRRPGAAKAPTTGRRTLQVTPAAHHAPVSTEPSDSAAPAVDSPTLDAPTTDSPAVGSARRNVRPRLLPASGEPTLADLSPQPQAIVADARELPMAESIDRVQHTEPSKPSVGTTSTSAADSHASAPLDIPQPPAPKLLESSSDELPTEEELSEALERRAPVPSILKTRPAVQNPIVQPPAPPRTAPVPTTRSVQIDPEQTPGSSVPDLPEFPSPGNEAMDESFGNTPPRAGQTPPREIPRADGPGSAVQPDPSLSGDQKVKARGGFMEDEAESNPAGRAESRAESELEAETQGELLTPEEEQALRDKASEYNGADCAADSKNCQTTRQELVDFSIANISIDVSPLLVTVGKDLNEVLKDRDEQLAKIPSRVWKDRNGQVLAEGRLLDYTNGYLVIQPKEGESVRVAAREIGADDRCFLSGWWRIPNDCQLPEETYAGRHWTPSTFTWTASALCHKPLYFEDVQLERYGHSQGPVAQTFLSGAHFFGNVLLLPYNIGLHPPQECQYVLGYYRPGDCAPWLIPAFPWHPRAVKAQTAAVLGGVFLIP